MTLKLRRVGERVGLLTPVDETLDVAPVVFGKEMDRPLETPGGYFPCFLRGNERRPDVPARSTAFLVMRTSAGKFNGIFVAVQGDPD
jgi:hypothetical protein